MKIVCRVRQRQLAKYATLQSPFPPRLERHTETCGECHAFYQDIGRIQQELPQALKTVSPAEEFDNALWARFHQQPLVPVGAWRSGYPVYIAVATSLGLIAVGYHQYTTPRYNDIVVYPMPATKSASLPQESPLKPATQSEIQVATTGFKQRYTYRPIHKKRTVPKALPAKKYVVAQTPKPKHTITWTQVGYYYAAQGAYQEAATAYHFAYQQQRDPRLAFVAGQAAEVAGDPIQALELFTQTLTSKPNQDTTPKSEKDKHDESYSPHRSLRNCSPFEPSDKPSTTVS